MVSFVTCWIILLVDSFLQKRFKKKKRRKDQIGLLESILIQLNNSLPGRGDCNLHHLELLKRRLAEVINVTLNLWWKNVRLIKCLFKPGLFEKETPFTEASDVGRSDCFCFFSVCVYFIQVLSFFFSRKRLPKSSQVKLRVRKKKTTTVLTWGVLLVAEKNQPTENAFSFLRLSEC